MVGRGAHFPQGRILTMLTRSGWKLTCCTSALAIGTGFGLGSLAMERRLSQPESSDYVALAAMADVDLRDPEFRAATADERKKATESIEAQLKAFKADDYRAAEKYQSEGLRGNFNDLGQFRRMMQTVYPQFANYRSVSFGQATANKDGSLVRVAAIITGVDGKTVRAVYDMVLEQGTYRVSGVDGGVPRRPRNSEVV